MLAALSSPIDPAIGHLSATAQSPDPNHARLLTVLAAVPDPPGEPGCQGS
jgi:hypothetical protein